MAFQIKNSGAWKLVNGLFVRDNGAWKTVQNAYIKSNGAWKKFFTNAVLLDFTVEVFGEGGKQQFNIQNYPTTAGGGYNKVTVQALSNRTGTFSSDSPPGGMGSAIFSIDGQWIVVAGGSSEPGNYTTW